MGKGLFAGAFWGLLVAGGMLTTAAILAPPSPLVSEGTALPPVAEAPPEGQDGADATPEPASEVPEEVAAPGAEIAHTGPPAADAITPADLPPEPAAGPETEARALTEADSPAEAETTPAVPAPDMAAPDTEAPERAEGDLLADLPAPAAEGAPEQETGQGTPPDTAAAPADVAQLPLVSGATGAGPAVSAPDSPLPNGSGANAPAAPAAEAAPDAPQPAPVARRVPDAPAGVLPPAPGREEDAPDVLAALLPPSPPTPTPAAPTLPDPDPAPADAARPEAAPATGTQPDMGLAALPQEDAPPEAQADSPPQAAQIDRPELRQREAPPPPLPDLALPDPPQAVPATEAPNEADAAPDLPRVGFDRLVEGVETGRLPRIAPSGEQEVTEDVAAEVPAPDPADLPALQAHAEAFDNPEGRPVFAILLLDDGVSPEDREILAELPFPVSFVVDPARPDAAEVAAAYRAGGKEVLMLASAIPAGATPADLEVTFAAHLRALPGAVALIDLPDGRVQNDRQLSQQVVTILQDSGHGLVTFDRGLNAADQVARSAGLGTARVFRALDAEDENAATIRRYLDRAVFRAAQEGQVVVLGNAGREQTLAGLLEWRMEGRAEGVALAPVSAVLQGAQ